MRSVVFRLLAGLLAIAFGVLLVFGDTSNMSLRHVWGTGAIAVGFGSYALLGSGLGERFIWVAGCGRDLDSQGQPSGRQVVISVRNATSTAVS